MGEKLQHQSEGTNRASYLPTAHSDEAFDGSMGKLSEAIINNPPPSVQSGPAPATPAEAPLPSSPVKPV